MTVGNTHIKVVNPLMYMTQNTQHTVTITKKSLKKLLEMHVDATQLLEEIPALQDQGRLSEASQHIGAELEGRITEMNQVEQNDHIIREILEQINNERINEPKTNLKKLEDDVLGDR